MAKRQRSECRELKYISSGTIDEFLKNIREAFEEQVPEEARATARCELEGSAYDSYSAEGVIRIHWSREETDAEEHAREAQEKAYRDARRLQYEALKKEFG